MNNLKAFIIETILAGAGCLIVLATWIIAFLTVGFCVGVYLILCLGILIGIPISFFVGLIAKALEAGDDLRKGR